MAATQVQKNELRDRVGKLVMDRFGGDYHKAFDYYDEDKDGKVSSRDLVKLLGDAGVGNWLTRGAWASGIIAEMDTDKDGSISKAEFDVAMRSDRSQIVDTTPAWTIPTDASKRPPRV
jgi:Ca2+-binding EF-hand superfamily protein